MLAGGINVLYLEGALRVDQLYLRRSLDASPDIKVDFVRLDPRELVEEGLVGEVPLLRLLDDQQPIGAR